MEDNNRSKQLVYPFPNIAYLSDGNSQFPSDSNEKGEFSS
mgnify:FL=1